MNPFKRHPEPDFLIQNAAHWSQQWAKLKTRNQGASFNWYKYKGKPVSKAILEALLPQTIEHCSFCDAFPLMASDKTIDHFQPKSRPDFYLKAYDWPNLYLACSACQFHKRSYYSSTLIRPDEKDYTFERYFNYNGYSHEIEVNPLASEHDQDRATETIRVFQLNENSRVISRQLFWTNWQSRKKLNLHPDDLPYRYLEYLID